MKIAIIGSPGSGKSRLGVKLQDLVKIPLYHLDQYQWTPGWQKRDLAEFEKIHNELCDSDQWIIEGCGTRFFEYRIKQADIIIFLDIARPVCLYRIFKRALTHFGKVYFSSAPGCPERFPEFSLLRYVVQFPYNHKPKTLELLNRYKNQKQFYMVQNSTELAALIKKFESPAKSESVANTPEITVPLVTKLIAEQFPQWSHLPLVAIKSGWDNRTFRLGAELLARLPSDEVYVPQVRKEHRWLPLIAPHLSFAIPNPVALGHPSSYYPFEWSIYRWIEGESADRMSLDEEQLLIIAEQLAQFLKELHAIDTTNGPVPGAHNFYRGGTLSLYDEETRAAIKKLSKLRDTIDVETVTRIWEKALSSTWEKNPVWVHGDLSSGNFLLKEGRISAIIDFGCMAIGDPACDLVIAWTLLKGPSRTAFQALLPLDQNTWDRARGWALWKALITLAAGEDSPTFEEQQRCIKEILIDKKLP